MKKQFSKKEPLCKVTFQLPQEAAPQAQSVLVVGDFNDWQPQQGVTLKLDKNGVFKADLELPVGREYQFRYLIDNSRWENDWSADKYVPSPFQGIENSVVSLLSAEQGKKSAQAAVKSTTPKASSTAISGTVAKKKDDLKKIEGIGAKLAERLQEAGIESYQDLANAKVANLKAILATAGARYKALDPSTWITQAKALLK